MKWWLKIVALLIAAGLLFGCYVWTFNKVYVPAPEPPKADTIWVYDTLMVYKYDTVKIDHFKTIRDTLIFVDTVEVGGQTNAIVELNLSKYEWYKKDLYHIWATGYKTSLDSVEVYEKTQIIREPVYISEKPKRLGAYINGGYEYKGSIDNNAYLEFIGAFDYLYIKAGAEYNFPIKKFQPYAGAGLLIRVK